VAWGQVYRIKDKCLTPIKADRSTDQEQATTKEGLRTDNGEGRIKNRQRQGQEQILRFWLRQDDDFWWDDDFWGNGDPGMIILWTFGAARG
jgi:hypothetical protein